jgi:hypothetical protein
MVSHDSFLVLVVDLVDRLPKPALAVKRGCPGNPQVYSDRLFLKALVITIVRHIHHVQGVLGMQTQPSAQNAATARPACSTSKVVLPRVAPGNEA